MRFLTFWSSLFMIFALPWENALVIPSLGTVSKAAGIVVAALWILTIAMERGFRKPGTLHLLALLFFTWNAVSLSWSIDTEATMNRLLTYGQLAAFIVVLWDLYRTQTALQLGLQAYVLGGFVSIGSIAFGFNAGSAHSMGRFTASGFNPNDVGLILSLGIPVAWYLAVSPSTTRSLKWLKLINYAYIPAALFGIALTASRGALIAVVPSMFLLVGTLHRIGIVTRACIIAGMIGLVIWIPGQLPQATVSRLSTIPESIQSQDIGGRVSIWHKCMSSIAEHPLLGVGANTFPVLTKRAAHNAFLSVLVELGLIGLAGFALILANAAFQAIQQPRLLAKLWLTLLLTWCLGASLLTWEHRKHTWLVFSWVTISAHCFARQNEPRSPRPASAFTAGPEPLSPAHPDSQVVLPSELTS